MADSKMLDAFLTVSRRMSSYEIAVLLVIMTSSSKWLTTTVLCEKTGILPTHVSRAKAMLFENNMILRNGGEVSIQPDTSLWRVRARRGRDKGKIQELNT